MLAVTQTKKRCFRLEEVNLILKTKKRKKWGWLWVYNHNKEMNGFGEALLLQN